MPRNTGSRASRLSTCDSQALEHRSIAAMHALSCSIRHVGGSQIRHRTHVSCIGRQILPKNSFLLTPHKSAHSLSRPFICWVCFKVHSSGSMLTVGSGPSHPLPLLIKTHTVCWSSGQDSTLLRQGMWLWSSVRELRSYLLRGVAKKKKRHNLSTGHPVTRLSQ